ncbi:binding-protein-dependent transport systems inner membrane component [Thermobaculum terrenum ATCC BAA-798]|uniref:Binding-protein-dependent transport systems inner membrane component n=1 Tax=Thermobaculum terrenum (strain ATCC BAA-798 / CCMEE 7001 / YNP1) TaxID=525904 RepID=D1CFB2_THET1|nr:ABC transporter permease [Thermobaculum terrenum]ACZ41618.1 binding-protein-dependent transport systems inner membrane component [Thermobaculum terrenum ATCC BAA-798]
MQAQEESAIQLLAEPSHVRDSYWQRFRRNRVTFVSFIVFVLIVLAALIGPFVYRVDPAATDFLAINSAPSLSHPLGTDNLGRDTLARLLQGLRVSLLVVLVVEAINVLLGATIGLLAGYLGGWVDNLLSRLADMLFAFPGLLLAILVAAVWGDWVTKHFGSIGRLLLVATALSLVSWPLMARFVRGETLSIREREFILAARALGVTDRRILLNHVLPNVTGLVITAATLDAVGVIINESVLSLLGLGTQPPMASIGRMINDAVKFFSQSQFQVFVPSAMLVLLVILLSYIGDGIRDVLDPYSSKR